MSEDGENKSLMENQSKKSEAALSKDILEKEERYRGNVPCRVFIQYWNESWGMFGVFLCLLFSVASAVCKILTSVWLERWSEAGSLAAQRQANYTTIYFLLVLGMFLSSTLSYLAISWMIAHQGRNIHNQMIKKMLGAPIGFF